MNKTYSILYDEYNKRYNNKPKYNFEYFLKVLSSIHHHRELIRPQIKWWSEIKLN